MNIASRQYLHDCKPINQKVVDASMSKPLNEWDASTLVAFGTSSPAQIPPPVLSAMETILLGVGGLTTTSHLNVNLMDRAPRYPRSLLRSVSNGGNGPSFDSELVDQAVRCWNILADEYDKLSLDEGKIGTGYHLLPIQMSTVCKFITTQHQLTSLSNTVNQAAMTRYKSVLDHLDVGLQRTRTITINNSFFRTEPVVVDGRTVFLNRVAKLREAQEARPIPNAAFLPPVSDQTMNSTLTPPSRGLFWNEVVSSFHGRP